MESTMESKVTSASACQHPRCVSSCYDVWAAQMPCWRAQDRSLVLLTGQHALHVPVLKCMKAVLRLLPFLLPGKPNWADDKWHGCCLREEHILCSTLWPKRSTAGGPLYTSCNSTFPTRVSHVFLSWLPYMQFWCTKEGKTITINKASILALNKNLEWFWS